MFEIGSTELLLTAVVALLVIGPKDLPKALRVLGRFTGKARAMTRHLRAGLDEMVRQSELEEMEKQWSAQNDRIMAETPADPFAAPPEQSSQSPTFQPGVSATDEPSPPVDSPTVGSPDSTPGISHP